MFKFTQSKEYRLVAEAGDTESLISSSENSEAGQSTQSHGSSTCTSTLLLFASSIIMTTFGIWIGQHFPTQLDATCTQHVSKYSPILEDISVSYNIVQYNGSFMHENIYRQDAGPEVDAAWNALGGSYRPIAVSDSLGAKAGLTKNHGRRKTEYGGGYLVFLEGMHQMHCLNFLRKSLYYNYEHYKSLGQVEFSNSDDIVRMHVSHCLDLIRTRLMCTVDIGVLGSVWFNRSDPQPFPDFNTQHVCRNFDEIREWAEQHQIPENVPEDYMELPGDDVRVWDAIP